MPETRLRSSSLPADTAPLDNPQLGWLSDLLRRAGAEARLPRIDEVSPRRIGTAALPTVILVDVEGPPRRYRLRLVGTAITRMVGRDSTGRYFDELAALHGPASDFYRRQFDHIADSGDSILVTVESLHRRRGWMQLRAILAPLAGPDGRILRIAAALEPPAARR